MLQTRFATFIPYSLQGQGQDWPHNLWGPVKLENAGPLVHKNDKEFQDGLQNHRKQSLTPHERRRELPSVP